MNTYPDGAELIINTGGCDTWGRFDKRPPYNNSALLEGYVLIQLDTGGGAWLPAAVIVRRRILRDYQAVDGLRFHEWQQQLWYTLLYHFYTSFTDACL